MGRVHVRFEPHIVEPDKQPGDRNLEKKQVLPVFSKKSNTEQLGHVVADNLTLRMVRMLNFLLPTDEVFLLLQRRFRKSPDEIRQIFQQLNLDINLLEDWIESKK